MFRIPERPDAQRRDRQLVPAVRRARRVRATRRLPGAARAVSDLRSRAAAADTHDTDLSETPLYELDVRSNRSTTSASWTARRGGPGRRRVTRLPCLGADVIKVESITRPDLVRYAGVKPPTLDQWWEWGPMFHGANGGKRGITLDLTRPEGVAVFERFARHRRHGDRELHAARDGAVRPRVGAAPRGQPATRDGAHAGVRPRWSVARSHGLRADDGERHGHGVGHGVPRQCSRPRARCLRPARRDARGHRRDARPRGTRPPWRGLHGRSDDGRGRAERRRRAGDRVVGHRHRVDAGRQPRPRRLATRRVPVRRRRPLGRHRRRDR